MMRQGLLVVGALLVAGHLSGCAGHRPESGSAPQSPPQASLHVLWDPEGRFFLLDPDGNRRLKQQGDTLVLEGSGPSVSISVQALNRPMYLAGYREAWKRVAAERYRRTRPDAVLSGVEALRIGDIDALGQIFSLPAGNGRQAREVEVITAPAGRILLSAELERGQRSQREIELLSGGLRLLPDLLGNAERRQLKTSSWGRAYAEAHAAAAQGQLPTAIERIARGREETPGTALLDYAYARFLAISRRDVNQAAVLLERLVLSHPASRDAQYNLAVVKALKGDLPGAIAEYRRYLVLEPEDVEALNNLAVLCVRAGRREDAMLALEGARAVSESFSLTFYHLGQLLRKTNPRAAAAALRTFLDKEPDSELAPAILELVNQLETDGG